ncbi:unnamed protein product, partial [Ectocarpus fasciculatus]
TDRACGDHTSCYPVLEGGFSSIYPSPAINKRRVCVSYRSLVCAAVGSAGSVVQHRDLVPARRIIQGVDAWVAPRHPVGLVVIVRALCVFTSVSGSPVRM